MYAELFVYSYCSAQTPTLIGSESASGRHIYFTNLDVKSYNYIAIAFYSSNSSIESITTTPTASQLIYVAYGLMSVYDVQAIDKITIDILGTNTSGMNALAYVVGF